MSPCWCATPKCSAHSRAAFEAAGIPYVVNRGRGFYDTREVNDLTHLLRVIANPRDEIALAAVLRSPLVDVPTRPCCACEMRGDNLGEALAGPRRHAAFGRTIWQLCAFRDRLREWRMRREHVTFDRLLLAAIDDCGYRRNRARAATPTSTSFWRRRAMPPRACRSTNLSRSSRWSARSNPREPDAPPEDSGERRQIMTVHSAKGLEFPIVFVAALHKGIEPNPPVVAFSPRIGLGARWRMPGTRDEKDDLFQHAIRAERKQREAEESHRLLYVAMTRAEAASGAQLLGAAAGQLGEAGGRESRDRSRRGSRRNREL